MVARERCGQRKVQQRGNFPVLESGHRVQHHQLPFGFIQLADELIQDEPIGFVSRRGAQKSLPILKGNGGAALCLPQFLQAEVARDGQNPGGLPIGR